jgi:hypothetical protein
VKVPNSPNGYRDSVPVELGFDIPQAFAIRQLRESHCPELVHTGEMLDAEIPLVPLHTTLKGLQRHEIHDLGEHKRA